MALLFLDGFDHVGTSANNLVAFGKWSSVNSNVLCATSPVRTGTHSMNVSTSAATITSKAFTVSGGVVVGAAWQTPAFSATRDLIQVLENTTIHMAIGITAGGLLTVKLGTTVLQTGTKVLAINSWYYIEFKAIIHDTTGSYELKVDGVTELSATNVDTRNGGTGIWDRIYLGSGSSSNGYWDDFYLCDTSGSAPRNTFLGALKIETLFPVTDAVAVGSNTGLTPSTGTDHGALVDEATPNTSDYNSSATVGIKDTYNYPAMTLTGTVLGIQTNLYVAKSDAAARSVCAVVRPTSTDFDGANVNPLTTFSYLSTVFPTNPQTSGEWTTSEIASLQVGMKVTV